MRKLKNETFLKYHAGCRLCHVAGYSNLCTFSQGGKCPFQAQKEAVHSA